MKRLLILLLLFASALHAQQQNFPGGSGGGLTQVAVLPGTCSLGIWDQLTMGNYGGYYCPQTNIISPMRGNFSTYVTDFGVKGGVQKGCTAIYNGTTTVTTGATDPPFTGTTIPIVMGTAAACAGSTGIGVVEVGAACPPTCISATVVGAHQITLSSPAAGSAGNGTTCCTIEWGAQDDGPALQAAFNQAVSNCPFDIELPRTGMFIGNVIYNTTSLCGTNGGGNYGLPGGTVHGSGSSTTVLYPLPNINLTTCAGSCLFGLPFGTQDLTLSGWSTDGGGVGTVTGGTNKVIYAVYASGSMQNLEAYQWGESTNFNMYACGAGVGAISNLYNLKAYNTGQEPYFLGNFCYAYNIYSTGCGPSIINPALGFVYTFGAQLIQNCSGAGGPGDIQINGTSAGTWESDGDFINGSANQIGITFSNTAPISVNFHHSLIEGTTGIVLAEAGATVHLGGNSSLTGTTAAISGGIAGSKFYFDDCTSSVGSNATWTNITVFQPCAPNNALLATGNLSLSANWGTGAATSAWQGADSPITFTITNGSGAVGAAPTITYTFPTAMAKAPLWCTVTQSGGTNPSLSPYAVSLLTNTGFVATATGTPTINDTEFMQVQCFTQ